MTVQLGSCASASLQKIVELIASIIRKGSPHRILGSSGETRQLESKRGDSSIGHRGSAPVSFSPPTSLSLNRSCPEPPTKQRFQSP
jgi:hypothetical protein